MKNTNEETQYTANEVVIECCIVFTLNFVMCGAVLPLMSTSILGVIGSLLFILISNVTSVTIADTITKMRRL